MQRMQEEGFISVDEPFQSDPARPSPVGRKKQAITQAQARFEVTDKSLDFLGYKTVCVTCLHLSGRSSFGRHDTRDMGRPASRQAAHRSRTSSATR